MAVRFLPPPDERGSSSGEDRPDLAEVIELRSELVQRRWLSRDAEEPADAEGAPGASDGTAAPEGEHHGAAAPVALRPARALLEDGAVGDAPRASRGALIGLAPEGLEGAPGTPRFERDAIGDAAGAGDEPDTESEPEAEGPSCSEDGVRLLARRARSSGELRSDLLALEHDPHEVEDVIAEFEANHYLDDAGLARALVEKLRDAKRASRAQIRRKLRERKLPDEAIEEALGELDDDEEFALLRETAAQRAAKLSGLDRQTAERRLLGFLARRGWSGEPAMRAAREALDRASRPNGGVRFR